MMIIDRTHIRALIREIRRQGYIRISRSIIARIVCKPPDHSIPGISLVNRLMSILVEAEKMRSPVTHKDRTHLFSLCPQEISRWLFKTQSDGETSHSGTCFSFASFATRGNPRRYFSFPFHHRFVFPSKRFPG